MSDDAASAEKVFDVTELSAMIFGYLSALELIPAQSTCKSWAKAIEVTGDCQKAKFLKPVDSYSVIIGEGFPGDDAKDFRMGDATSDCKTPREEVYPVTKLHPFFKEPSLGEGEKELTFEFPLFDIYRSKHADFEDMFITQPPCDMICVNGAVHVTIDGGVMMIHLRKARKDWLEDQCEEMCCSASVFCDDVVTVVVHNGLEERMPWVHEVARHTRIREHTTRRDYRGRVVCERDGCPQHAVWHMEADGN